jgi:hypothetical protein
VRENAAAQFDWRRMGEAKSVTMARKNNWIVAEAATTDS